MLFSNCGNFKWPDRPTLSALPGLHGEILVFRSRRLRAIRAMSAILNSPAAPARRLNPDALAFFQAYTRLARKRFPAAVMMHDLCSSGRAISAALQPVRSAATAIGQ